MKQKLVMLIAAGGLGLAIAIGTGKAVANSAAFSFTMEMRAVWGNRNGKFHTLDAGELTLSGDVWVVSKNGGANSTPDVVTIEVHRGTGVSAVCSVKVTPSTTFNDKRTFDKSCGRVESGSYWVFVERTNPDGWHLKGSGTLVTK